MSKRFTSTRVIGPIGPTFAAGDRVWFYPVASRRVSCVIVGYDVNAAQYQLRVTASSHPVYARNETLFSSVNWLGL